MVIVKNTDFWVLTSCSSVDRYGFLLFRALHLSFLLRCREYFLMTPFLSVGYRLCIWRRPLFLMGVYFGVTSPKDYVLVDCVLRYPNVLHEII